MSFWITAEDECKASKIYWFSKKFDATANASLNARICGETRYQVYINGNMLCEGPCMSPHSVYYYDTVDMTKYLRVGENEIRVKLLLVRENHFFTVRMGTQPLFWLDGELRDGERVTQIGTNDDWICTRDDSVIFSRGQFVHPSMPPFEEHLEQASLCPVSVKRLYEPNLSSCGYNAYGIREKYPLSPRPIPQMETQMGINFKISRQGEGFIELDAGEYTTAKVLLKLSGEKGNVIKVIYSECYALADGKNKIKTYRDHPENDAFSLYGPCDLIHLNGEEQTLEPFWYRAFRFIRLEYQGQIDLISAIYFPYFYPIGEEGSFECSDNTLNKIWYVSRRTMLCCTHETWVDGPHYEQAQYQMDSGLEMLFHFRLSSDSRIALKSLKDLAVSQLSCGLLQANYPSREVQIIPNFTLFWVLMLRNYLRYTGDIESVRTLAPIMDRGLEAFEALRRSDGLVDCTPYWNYVDWGVDWNRGVPTGGDDEPLTVTNMMYVAALRAGAEIFELTGKELRAREYRSRADELGSIIVKLCYDSQARMFRDTPSLNNYSQHTATWAVISDIVTDIHAVRLMERVIEATDISRCSFSMNYYLFRALEKTGLYSKYVSQLFENWRDMLNKGCTTWGEAPYYTRSECHGWSSTPIYEISRMVLGVYPEGDGFESIRIAPQIDGLAIDFACGAVPTPHGKVKVSWKLNGSKFTLCVEAPQGAVGRTQVTMPDGACYTVDESKKEYKCLV